MPVLNEIYDPYIVTCCYFTQTRLLHIKHHLFCLLYIVCLFSYLPMSVT